MNLWLLSTIVKEGDCVSVYEGREPLVLKAYGLRYSRLVVGGLLALHNECGEHEKGGNIRGEKDWGMGCGGGTYHSFRRFISSFSLDVTMSVHRDESTKVHGKQAEHPARRTR